MLGPSGDVESEALPSCRSEPSAGLDRLDCWYCGVGLRLGGLHQGFRWLRPHVCRHGHDSGYGLGGGPALRPALPDASLGPERATGRGLPPSGSVDGRAFVRRVAATHPSGTWEVAFTSRRSSVILGRSCNAFSPRRPSIGAHLCAAAPGWYSGRCMDGGWHGFAASPSMCRSISTPSCTCVMSPAGWNGSWREHVAANPLNRQRPLHTSPFPHNPLSFLPATVREHPLAQLGNDPLIRER